MNPRKIPLGLKLNIYFGGEIAFVGWVFIFIGIFGLLTIPTSILQTNPIILIVFIFPIIGMVIITVHVLKAVRSLHLIRTGLITQAKLLTVKRTFFSVNDKALNKVTYRYTDTMNMSLVTHTHLPFTEEPRRDVTVYYNQDNTKESIIIDYLPGRPTIGSNGEIVSFSLVKLIFRLSLTVIVLVIFLK